MRSLRGLGDPAVNIDPVTGRLWSAEGYEVDPTTGAAIHDANGAFVAMTANLTAPIVSTVVADAPAPSSAATAVVPTPLTPVTSSMIATVPRFVVPAAVLAAPPPAAAPSSDVSIWLWIFGGGAALWLLARGHR